MEHMTREQEDEIDRLNASQGRADQRQLPDGAGVVLGLIVGLAVWAAMALVFTTLGVKL